MDAGFARLAPGAETRLALVPDRLTLFSAAS